MPDTLKENIELVETFKKVTSIRTSKTLKDIKSEKNVWKHSEADEIIIFENVFTDCQGLDNYLLPILSDPEAKERCTITLVTLVMGVKAKIDLIKATSSFSNFKYVYLLEIDENKISPFSTTSTFFETKEEALYALSEVRKFFPHVDSSSLTILLEYLCPSKSLPIFWASTKNFEPIFPNAYGVLDRTLQDGEQLRQRLYEVNTKFSQKLNSSILEYLKWKARKLGIDDWFNVQLIPAKILTEISNRWIEDRQTYPKESYFSFIHYKDIIKMHNKDLGPIFQFGPTGFEWCDKLNILRRDPAHPEKPAPKLSDVEYYESVAEELTRRMLTKLPFKD